MMRKDLMSMETILEVEDICKSFAGNRVLDDVTFSTEVGQVHALVGENGAGKTTLMNIIGGIHQPDEGTIYLQAMQSGISIVHQELSLVPNLNVAQNIFSNGQTSSMASREKLNRLGFIKWKELYADTRELLEHVRIDIEPTTMVSKLPVSIQQLVEIARAISFDAQVLILDEPTSALSEKEIDHLYDVIRELKEKGVAVVFISHKLAEVFTIADQVSVLRDGKMVGTVKTEETSRDEIIQMMVGRHIEDMYPDKSSEVKDTILSVEGFSRPPYFQVRWTGRIGANRSGPSSIWRRQGRLWPGHPGRRADSNWVSSRSNRSWCLLPHRRSENAWPFPQDVGQGQHCGRLALPVHLQDRVAKAQINKRPIKALRRFYGDTPT
jgi:inositol transport system ATP-binding protein